MTTEFLVNKQETESETKTGCRLCNRFLGRHTTLIGYCQQTQHKGDKK